MDNNFRSSAPQVQLERSTQATSHLLMVRPVRFGYNDETAQNNAFQNESSLPNEEIQAKALVEFDLFVSLLRAEGITVTVFDDNLLPHTPDSIFPNNWISFHETGKIIIYPMFAVSRRLERRGDIIDHFKAQFLAPEVIDLSHYEEQGLFLEGTGSMIMDRVHQKVYACLSPRTTQVLFEEFCEHTQCEGFLFHATDRNGTEIYHTNVMMALGSQLAVICMEAIRDPWERNELERWLQETSHQILPISFTQMEAFAGNMLQLYNHQGEALMVMSQRAFKSLQAVQITTLEKYSRLLVVPIDIIETIGGGSVRCMMAEVFTDAEPGHG
ncbi:MAG: arginine deiminase-related protein [Bacteroidota bacterium]